MTRDLLAMADWMAAQRVTHVAMESTGVYWKPIYNILESRFTVLLVNARHLKQVPGRKSDVRDCQWIAQLQLGTPAGRFGRTGEKAVETAGPWKPWKKPHPGFPTVPTALGKRPHPDPFPTVPTASTAGIHLRI